MNNSAERHPSDSRQSGRALVAGDSPLSIRWRVLAFAELDAATLLDALILRQEVFIVEQRCVYRDADDYDRHSLHLLGHAGDGPLAAYARLIPPQVKYSQASIGRVVTASAFRRSGLGRLLMHVALGEVWKRFGADIRIPAQQYLEPFYQSLGFVTISAPYDEDGIQHVDMVRRAGPVTSLDA